MLELYQRPRAVDHTHTIRGFFKVSIHPDKTSTLVFHTQTSKWSELSILGSCLSCFLFTSQYVHFISPEWLFMETRGSFLSLAASPFLFLSLPCGELLVTSLIMIILEITSTSAICLLLEAFLQCSSRRASYSAACFQHSAPLLWVTEGKSGSKAASILVF